MWAAHAAGTLAPLTTRLAGKAHVADLPGDLVAVVGAVDVVQAGQVAQIHVVVARGRDDRHTAADGVRYRPARRSIGNSEGLRFALGLTLQGATGKLAGKANLAYSINTGKLQNCVCKDSK